MKVCVLYSSDDVSQQGPLDEPVRAPIEVAEYGPGHKFAFFELTNSTAVRTLKMLAGSGFDVFLNLCDGAWDEARPGIEVVQTLERMGMPFTGAGSSFYEPTREAMKIVCHYLGIAHPRGVMVVDAAQAATVASKLRYPMIVKHPNSYSSIGMTSASRVQTTQELAEQIERMVAQFGGALVEEFVEGREYTVLVTEPRDGELMPYAYPPVECVMPAGETFKHYDLKWRDYELLRWTAVADDALANELMRISAELFRDLGGSGYARCDVRVTEEGIPHVLEINPNCAVFYPPALPGGADAVLQLAPGGHEQFIENILAQALKRQRDNQRRYVVEIRSEQRGYGMYAVVPIAAGEHVTRGEEQHHRLVSRSHAAAHWPRRELQWLEQYGYPLNDEVFVTWSEDPEQWSPINHSCDPNTWIQGLDLVARRPITVGEEITVDYATFIAGTGASFDCQCGAVDCRAKISPDDWQRLDVRSRYQGHVAAYVEGKWRSGPV